MGGGAAAAGAAAGAAAAAAAATRKQATRASGVIVHLPPREWLEILAREEAPLVVHARGGFLRAWHVYLTSHRGLAFATRAGEPLDLPPETELVEADRISLP